ncbi:hypothetical protein [Phocaeicola coprophilus]|uniref:hypothetical protein n=1 Tax=Phocaeicola coprophilus TaxID=387090 RepID=UPI0026DB2526|nr:hypothetical protein [Phocaeicola coprophilus]
MKYGKITEGTLQTLEVEKGVQVGGKLTEEEIIAQGYKPVCEVEQPSDAEFCVYREYDVCFVQIWKRTGEEVQEDEIWTAESGVMPKYSDLERLKKDVAMVNEIIGTLNLTNKEALSVKEFYPEWSADSVQVKKGEKYQHVNKLYEADQDHVTQENWSPDKMSSLWHEVTDHAGTLEDPIPYNEDMNPWWQGMILEEGKYYTQSGVVYKCIRGTGNKVIQNLADLVSGGFVQKV